MDYNTLSQAIGALGFPIACSCGFFWMINTTIKDFTTIMRKMDTTLTAILEHEREREANANA